jgi:four helix bundle protein
VGSRQKGEIVGGKDYTDLIAWKRAMDLVENVYHVTKTFPSEEKFGLTSQLRRAVVSIPSNIAEGQGRRSKKEFANFLSIAHGSLREVETQLRIAKRLEYLPSALLDELLSISAETGRLITGLANSLS